MQSGMIDLDPFAPLEEFTQELSWDHSKMSLSVGVDMQPYCCVGKGMDMHNGMLDLDPFAPMEEFTQGLPKSLHKVATNAIVDLVANLSQIETQYIWLV